MLSFGILGPLTVLGADGRPRPLDPRQTRVLATLLVSANRTLPMPHLIDAVWDDKPPATARRQLQNVVSALRQLHGIPIDAERPGYRLTVHSGQLDAGVFADRVARARRLGRTDDAVREFREALAIWRGPALAGCAGRHLEAAAARLDEQRLAVIEECLDLELALGRHDRLVGELAGLVAANPLRERVVGQLMVALHRSGRRAEALATYDRLRSAMVEDLGLDPGTELRELRTTLLRGEPETVDRTDVPRQLPTAPRHFVGRGAELKVLSTLVDAGTVTISALAGTGGIGKTTLALHWAHRMADAFPDGQLYVNLRGFDPSGSAVAPEEAVRGFLAALGVPAAQIPTGLDAQTALYRSLLADRRMLVLLDNAGDVEQVRPLLPGGGRSLVLVTSRNDLTGLVASEGAYPIELDVLAPAEARELLARHLGPDRLGAEPVAVQAIVDSCAGLPLALAVVAARAAARPAFPLATLAAELGDARLRLDALDTGDRMTAVRTVFSWSYRRLSDPAATVFRRLGLHPGPDVSGYAAASLADLPLPLARRTLAELARAHLVTEQTPGRYAVHDLLRAYAAELAGSDDPEDVRTAAVRRLLHQYLATAQAAVLLLSPHRDPVPTPEPDRPPEPLAVHDEALAWFAAEYPVLLAAVTQATAAGFDRLTWHLARNLTTFLSRRGYWLEDVRAWRAALASAQRLGDQELTAHGERSLGRAYTRLGRLDDALVHMGRALDAFERLGDGPGQAGTHLAISMAYEAQGRLDRMLEHTLQAYELYRAAGRVRGQADTLNAVGMAHSKLGDYREAVAYCRRALALYQELADRHGEAAAWDSIAVVHHHLGEHRDAAACYRKAIELCQAVGDRYHEADTLTRLAETYRAGGDPAAARESWQRALALLDELGHPDAEVVRGRLAGHL